MQYNIKGTGIQITDELRAYVEKKLAIADKLMADDSTALCDVELEFAPARDGGKYCAEFNLSAHGNLHRVEKWGMTMHEAIDLAIGELDAELRREKKKRMHLIRRGATKLKEFVRGWTGR